MSNPYFKNKLNPNDIVSVSKHNIHDDTIMLSNGVIVSGLDFMDKYEPMLEQINETNNMNQMNNNNNNDGGLINPNIMNNIFETMRTPPPIQDLNPYTPKNGGGGMEVISGGDVSVDSVEIIFNNGQLIEKNPKKPIQKNPPNINQNTNVFGLPLNEPDESNNFNQNINNNQNNNNNNNRVNNNLQQMSSDDMLFMKFKRNFPIKIMLKYDFKIAQPSIIKMLHSQIDINMYKDSDIIHYYTNELIDKIVNDRKELYNIVYNTIKDSVDSKVNKKKKKPVKKVKTDEKEN